MVRAKQIIYEIYSYPFIDHMGRLAGAIEYVRDVTEQKKVEQTLQIMESQFLQAQKLESLGRLAGGVAHDFNNMLAVILGYTEVALMELGPQQSIRKNLEEVKSAAQRSADLVRHLLAFARKQVVSPKILNVNDTVSDLLKILQRLIGEDIELIWKPGPDLWNVLIDPSQIDQFSPIFWSMRETPSRSRHVDHRDGERHPRRGLLAPRNRSAFLGSTCAWW